MVEARRTEVAVAQYLVLRIHRIWSFRPVSIRLADLAWDESVPRVPSKFE